MVNKYLNLVEIKHEICRFIASEIRKFKVESKDEIPYLDSHDKDHVFQSKFRFLLC